MAKGNRGKQTANGPNPNTKNNKANADKENSIDAPNNTQSGKGRNRHREKQKLINNDDPKPEPQEETSTNSNHVEKKDALPVHPKVQPTTEQLMIAKIIDHSDDPHQRKKIQQVMDVTGKPEDEVATALFDAGWDESRAVELLLEDGPGLSAWEETGKKKKGKKTASDEKDDWDNENNDNVGGFQDPREKTRGQRGPPRMRRGGGQSAKGSGREFAENGDQVVPSGGRGGRRGDQPPRRGGRGGGGGRSGGFSSRQQSNTGSGGTGGSSSGPSGFQGSIDTWNNPNDTQTTSGDRSSETGAGSGGRGRSHRGGRGGSQTGKDAFDNAGNWGDDFPQADDWDNEEYTGSLADTKVFTASGGPNPKQKLPAAPPQQQQQSQQQQQQQQQPVGANSRFNLTNGPSSSAYSQSIDLSTLLQKPTTQSSVGSASSAAPGAQFNQQAATETLKAVVGIGGTTSQASKPAESSLYSYAQASSAFTSINKGQPSGTNQGQRPPPKAVGGRTSASTAASGGRITAGKAPAVEMPGDSLGRLDVQFGGLDLQFGGSGSASSEAMTSGFEFGAGDEKVTPSSNSKANDVASFAPTAKEVNKSLSNPLTSSGKLQAGAGVAGNAANPAASSQQDSFSKTPSSVVPAVPTVGNTVTPLVTSNSGGGVPGAGGASTGNSYNKQGGGSAADLAGYSYNNYKGYNNYQYQQYPNSNNFSSQQQQGSSAAAAAAAAGSSSQYKGGQYDKYDPQMNNPAAAVLGLANTNTTNALSGKVSATTASKVNMPNLPPGVASMLHPQYMAAGLAPAAFYGLQQPMAYGAYGNTGLEDLAAIQRASASAAGLHTLPTTGYYDPSNQFAATSLGAAVAGNNRDGSSGGTGTANTNLNSLAAIVSNSNSASSNSATAIGSSSAASSGFGSTSVATSTAANNSIDSTSSPGPATSSSGGQGSQHHVQQAQQQQTAFNLAATNAFAAQQMPPGYAYYFGNMGNMGLQPYGATTPGHVYQPTAMTVPGAGATATSQFQKSYGTSYGSGYDGLGQQGNKDFTSNYSSNGQSKSTGGSAAAGTGKGAHQYWGNTLTSTQLW